MTIITLLHETAQEEAHEMNAGGVVEHSHLSPLNIIEDPLIADPVFKHINETYTTRDIAKYNCISKAWKTLVFDNMLGATSDTYMRDWYFPLRFERTCSKDGGRHSHKWTSSGVHHPSLEFHSLPDIPETIMEGQMYDQMDYETEAPFGWECADNIVAWPTNNLATYYYPNTTLLTVAGGLMLFGDWKEYIDNDWKPLSVYNPLTKESRELPRLPTYHHPMNDGWNNRHIVDMVVDEKARLYKVIITSRDSVFAYKSASNSWSLRYFQEEAPLVLESPVKAIVDGKLHFAQLEINGELVDNGENMQTLAYVEVYEVDEDAGTWTVSIRVALRDYFSATFDGFMGGSCDVALVECMGRLYALIPTLLHIHKTMEKEIMEAQRIVELKGMKTYNDYGYLPLQFYILPLGGGGGVRQLMIRPPHSENTFGIEDRRTYAMRMLETPKVDWQDYRMQDNWVQCHSRGSVIWVTFSFGDYLLRYDMVSGRSETFILPGLCSHSYKHSVLDYRGNRNYNQTQMVYSPSFFMKP